MNSRFQLLSVQNNTLGKQRTVISIKPLLRENGEKLILPSFADFCLSVNIST